MPSVESHFRKFVRTDQLRARRDKCLTYKLRIIHIYAHNHIHTQPWWKKLTPTCFPKNRQTHGYMHAPLHHLKAAVFSDRYSHFCYEPHLGGIKFYNVDGFLPLYYKKKIHYRGEIRLCKITYSRSSPGKKLYFRWVEMGWRKGKSTIYPFFQWDVISQNSCDIKRLQTEVVISLMLYRDITLLHIFCDIINSISLILNSFQ